MDAITEFKFRLLYEAKVSEKTVNDFGRKSIDRDKAKHKQEILMDVLLWLKEYEALENCSSNTIDEIDQL